MAFLHILKNNFLFSCTAHVLLEYFPLESFAFIMNDVISKETVTKMFDQWFQLL